MDIIELYKSGMTTYQISDLCNIPRKRVSKILKENNIQINQQQRKFINRKTHKLTDRQKEILLGTLLGDGCIAPHGRKNKSYRFIVGHCEEQKELTEWLNKELQPLSGPISRKIDKRDNSITYNFATLTHKEFEYYEKAFYINRIKIVPKDLIYQLTPLSLAIWVMDDGSLSKSNIYLHTESFTEKENHMLKDMLLEKFNIIAKVMKFKRGEKIYFYIKFNKENSLKLIELIKEYILPIFYYKVKIF